MWYPAVTITAPVQEPLTLATAKQFLRIDADLVSFDVEVTAAILGARGEVESWTGSRLITQVVTVQADRWEDLAHLPIGPVQELLSVSWRTRDLADEEIGLDTLELFGGAMGQGIRPRAGHLLPGEVLRRCGNRYHSENTLHPDLILTVELRVGYGDDGSALPADLSVALLLAARGIYDDKTVDLSSRLASHRVWR